MASLSTPSITTWQCPGAFSCPGAVSWTGARAGKQAGQEPVPQAPDVASGGRPLPRRGFQSRRHADDPGDIVGAGPSLPFLSAAVQDGLERDRPSQGKGADALRSAELVGAHADHVRARRQLGDVIPGHGLDGVGVQDGVRGAPAHDACDLGQGLHGADLVVDELDGNQAHAVVQGRVREPASR